jgi:hypothetical protein
MSFYFWEEGGLCVWCSHSVEEVACGVKGFIRRSGGIKSWCDGERKFFFKKRALVNSVLGVRSLSPGPTAREHEESKQSLTFLPRERNEALTRRRQCLLRDSAVKKSLKGGKEVKNNVSYD